MEQEIRITKTNTGKRLDKFLVEKFSNYSRSFLQKIIKEDKVTINAKKSSAHTKLKENDVIQIELRKPTSISLEPEPKIKLDIVYENNDFIILNKPAGLVVHPSPSTTSHTLVNGLIAYYPQIAKVGENPLRPGIVHRLDKDVSGLMIVAKNQKAFFYLKEQLQKKLVGKKYLALVYGKINPPNGEINLAIGRSKNKPYRMAIKKNGEGRVALTYYHTIKSVHQYSLLEIETKTGRTHQIRVHLFALGYPIVGDKIYYPKKLKTKNKLNRLFLHAFFLEFYDLKKEKRSFKLPLPKALTNFLTSF